MRKNKDNIYSIIGTVLFHAAIILILWFTVLKSAVYEEDGGILVNFGNVDTSAGMFEPMYTGNYEPAEEAYIPPDPQAEPSIDEMITQDIEETVSLADSDAKKKEEEEEKRLAAERERQMKIEAERRLEEERIRKQEAAIRDRVTGAFGMGQASEGNQGTATTGTGNQGNPFGNSDNGANEGVGGQGGTFMLTGRSIRTEKLPQPQYTAQEEGRVVVNITVDPKGNVIYAEIGRGTNIDNSSMRNSALEAAKKAKFNDIDGTNNQSGTITYNYSLK